MAFSVDDNGRVLDDSGNPLTADPRRNAYNSGMIVGADGSVYDLVTLLGGGANDDGQEA